MTTTQSAAPIESVWLDVGRGIFANGERIFRTRDGIAVELVPRRCNPLAAYLMGIVAGGAITFASALGLADKMHPRDFGAAGFSITELTEAERAQPIHQAVPPIDIELRVLPIAEFMRERPTSGTVAFAYTRRRPCRIVIPEGWRIWALSERKIAFWDDRDSGNVLAHEILHCIRGSWHEDP